MHAHCYQMARAAGSLRCPVVSRRLSRETLWQFGSLSHAVGQVFSLTVWCGAAAALALLATVPRSAVRRLPLFAPRGQPAVRPSASTAPTCARRS